MAEVTCNKCGTTYKRVWQAAGSCANRKVKEKNVMDAVNYIEESRRMCSMFWGVCEKCPAKRGDECIIRRNALSVAAGEQVKIVEGWSAAHPLKTRQSVFMEQWPDVWLDGNRVISVSPCTLSKEYRDMNCDLRDCAECRKEFWMKEVE